MVTPSHEVKNSGWVANQHMGDQIPAFLMPTMTLNGGRRLQPPV
jgi:hypothetical protein